MIMSGVLSSVSMNCARMNPGVGVELREGRSVGWVGWIGGSGDSDWTRAGIEEWLRPRAGIGARPHTPLRASVHSCSLESWFGWIVLRVDRNRCHPLPTEAPVPAPKRTRETCAPGKRLNIRWIFRGIAGRGPTGGKPRWDRREVIQDCQPAPEAARWPATVM